MKDLEKLLPRLRNKFLEITLGDEYEEIVLSDFTRKINGIIYGKLEDVIGDFLVLNCFYVNREGELCSGNMIYLNCWQVKAMTEVKTNGSLNDAMVGTEHINKIRRLIGLIEK